MRFELEVRGVQQARRRVHGVGERARDARPAFEDIADELRAGERRQFRSGEGWPRLAASTRARKRRQRLDPRVMRATGTLERALTRRRAPGQLLRITRDEVRFGLKGGRSKAYYGRFHQKGRGVPVRKVVVFDQRSRRRVRGILADYLTGP